MNGKRKQSTAARLRREAEATPHIQLAGDGSASKPLAGRRVQVALDRDPLILSERQPALVSVKLEITQDSAVTSQHITPLQLSTPGPSSRSMEGQVQEPMEHVLVSVEGIHEGWVQGLPVSVPLEPGKTATAIFTLTVPAGEVEQAGEIVVRACSEEERAEEGRTTARWRVVSTAELLPNLAPKLKVEDGVPPIAAVGRSKPGAPYRRWLAGLAGLLFLLIIGDLFLWVRDRYINFYTGNSKSTTLANKGKGTPAAAGKKSAATGKSGKLLTRGPFACDPVDPNTVRDDGVPILTVTEGYDQKPPRQRAEQIARRLNDCFLNDLVPPRTVMNLRQGILEGRTAATQYVFFGYLHKGSAHETADVIATVDPRTARRFHTSPEILACWWRDMLRDWLLISKGKAPIYTIRYESPLQQFYEELKKQENKQSSTAARFQQSMSALIDSDYGKYEQLRLLYSHVPENYRPHPDDYQPILADDGKP